MKGLNKHSVYMDLNSTPTWERVPARSQRLSSKCVVHALPVSRSRKNGGQRSSAEAAPTIQTSDSRRVNYPPDPGARGMEPEKSGRGRVWGEQRLFVAWQLFPRGFNLRGSR